MMRPTVIASIGAIVLAMLALFIVKYEVKDLEQELAVLNDDKQRHVESIRVLRSEWSYLNRPERIADLADRHLVLEPVVSGQLTSLPPRIGGPLASLPMPPERKRQ
jgi:hypothetical protein